MPLIGIAASRFNLEIVDHLLKDTLHYLSMQSIPASNIEIIRVPGAFELPFAAQRLIKQKNCDVVIALGAVIRGETPHFDYVCSACTQGLMKLMLKHSKPVILGVLTTETVEQAWARAKGEVSDAVSKKNSSGNGIAFAKAALDMLKL